MSSLVKILKKEASCKSVWFMRQAGRYLPEFRKIRSSNKNFIELCLNSELSSEITLQPIQRFNLDSAIIFSDILIVPYALGQNVNFSKEFGPELSPFNIEKFLSVTEEDFIKSLKPIYKSIKITRNKLDKKKSLICFIGAPWTLLIYILGVKKEITSIDKIINNSNTNIILEKLIKFLNIHIKYQIKAGADVVQIFDSWAGLLTEANLEKFCFNPNAQIVKFCKENEIPNICFPRGINKYYENFNKLVCPDGINIDYNVDPKWIKAKLNNVVIQGGLDPKYLLRPDDEMFKAATKYLKLFNDTPYIFNLGHGLLPETDPDKVEKLINFYRSFDG